MPMHAYMINTQPDDVHLGEFLQCVADEIYRARKKYPTNKHTLHALSEESGKVAQAALDHFSGKASEHQVRKECVQTAAMAARFYLEGDEDLPYIGVSKVKPTTPVLSSPDVPTAIIFPRYDQMRIKWRDAKVTVVDLGLTNNDEDADSVVFDVYAAMRQKSSLPGLYSFAIDED